MKKRILFAVVMLCGLSIQVFCNDTTIVKPLYQPKIHLFSLQDVQLLNSDFKHIMDLDHKYLLSIDPDRLTSWFRREAGLTPKAQPYPYWESEDVWGKGPLAGHIMGFYLSSMSMMYQSTGDTAVINRLHYILNELDECQQAQGDGYLLATINGRQVFQDVVAKNFTTSNPLINDSWEPVYIMNKIMLGLYGVYKRCNIPLAKDIFLKMTNWFGDSVLNKLSHDDIQKLLYCEHGSINENYINAYQITANKKYLTWAKELNDEDMWVPLSAGKDILNGWHANTQISKFTGFENVYDYTGDSRFTNAAKNFWDIVVGKHTWSIGGNSTGEHFFEEKQFENRITQLGGPESCNSVNMLRLTEKLYEDYAEPEKIDYYERVLFNHILANYDPEEGMCVYYTSMRPGHYKIYGTEFNSFWCCTGTGMESPAKFSQMIYAYDSNSLYVNLFIPSKVTWQQKNISVTQNTKFPDENTATFTITDNTPGEVSIKIRHPKWLNTSTLPVTINGEAINIDSSPGGYAELKRVWKKGDVITVTLNCKISVEPLIASDKFLTVFYGPVAMAAKIDNHGLTKDDFRMERQTVALKEIPLSDVPSFIGNDNNIASHLIKEDKQTLTLKTSNNISTSPIELIPFNRIAFNRYAVYFRHFDNEAAYEADEKKEMKDDSLASLLHTSTIDSVLMGDSISELQHKIEAVNSNAGSNSNKRWRHATDGGYFMYDMKILPGEKQYIYMEFAKADNGKRVFDVYADGRLLQTIDHSKPADKMQSDIYPYVIQLPEGITRGKTNITIKFQAKRNNTAGGIFNLRIVKEDMADAILNNKS